MNHGEKLGKLIYLEIRLETNPQNQKSLNLDQDSKRNHRVNKREISEIKNFKKTKIEIKID